MSEHRLLTPSALIEMERITASVTEARDRAASHQSAAAVVPPTQVSNQPVTVML